MSVNLYRQNSLVPITETKGHKISNEEGTIVSQRKILKFLNADIVDDPINDRTIISFIGQAPPSDPIPIPVKISTTLTYNGNIQSITWEDPISTEYVRLVNDTATNAGNYTCVASLKKPSYVWEDGTSEPKNYYWSIGKANGSVSASITDVNLTADNPSAVIPLSIVGDGIVTVSNSNPTVYSVEYNVNTHIITINAIEGKSGDGVITITLGEGTNYFGSTLTINVSSTLVTELVAWTDGNIVDIANMLNAYYNDRITLEQIQEVWHVGDSRTVEISAMEATGVSESHRAQSIKMTIIDFEHDDLTTSINGHTKALITLHQEKCLMDADTNDTNGQYNTEHGYMNAENTNATGWGRCARRTWGNNVFFNALPQTFREQIKAVDKITSIGDQSDELETTSDLIFMPSEIEMYGLVTNSKPGEGSLYSFYETAVNRNKSPHWGSAHASDVYFTRSPKYNNSTHYCSVNTNGNVAQSKGNATMGLAMACCM